MLVQTGINSLEILKNIFRSDLTKKIGFIYLFSFIYREILEKHEWNVIEKDGLLFVKYPIYSSESDSCLSNWESETEQVIYLEDNLVPENWESDGIVWPMEDEVGKSIDVPDSGCPYEPDNEPGSPFNIDEDNEEICNCEQQFQPQLQNEHEIEHFRLEPFPPRDEGPMVPPQPQPHVPNLRLADEHGPDENGDVANNNRDGEGNNALPAPAIPAQILEPDLDIIPFLDDLDNDNPPLEPFPPWLLNMLELAVHGGAGDIAPPDLIDRDFNDDSEDSSDEDLANANDDDNSLPGDLLGGAGDLSQ